MNRFQNRVQAVQKQLYSTIQKNLHLQYPIVLLLRLQQYYLMLQFVKITHIIRIFNIYI